VTTQGRVVHIHLFTTSKPVSTAAPIALTHPSLSGPAFSFMFCKEAQVVICSRYFRALLDRVPSRTTAECPAHLLSVVLPTTGICPVPVIFTPFTKGLVLGMHDGAIQGLEKLRSQVVGVQNKKVGVQ